MTATEEARREIAEGQYQIELIRRAMQPYFDEVMNRAMNMILTYPATPIETKEQANANAN